MTHAEALEALYEPSRRLSRWLVDWMDLPLLDDARRGDLRDWLAALPDGWWERFQRDERLDEPTATLRPIALSMHGERRFEGSTELYVSMVTDLSDFWVALGKREGDEPLAYLHFVAFHSPLGGEVMGGQKTTLFELHDVRPGHDATPGRCVSWSGVLWHRRAALEAHQTMASYLAGIV